MPRRILCLENTWVRFQGQDYMLARTSYANGRTALLLVDMETGEPAAWATANLPDQHLYCNEVFIQDWGDNEGMLEALERAGIVRPTGERVPCGNLPVHKCQLLIQEKSKTRTCSLLGTTKVWPERDPSRGQEHER